MISGPAAEWLAARRDELNLRFVRFQRRFPALEAEPVLSALAEVLPPLAGPEPASGDLLSAVYDLVLLHAGRDTLDTRPGVGVLLREVFPRLRPLLLQRPSVLPGALSNAVENLEGRGVDFARTLAQVAPQVERAEALLDAGAVLAWRIGEARLRESALEVASRLPPRVALVALGLEDWPDEAAALAIQALRADAWHHPRALLSEKTLASLRGAPPQRVQALAQELIQGASAAVEAWSPVARVGDFAGFGGSFESPPLVLDGGSRHQLFARSGEQEYRVDADVFGWTCRPHPPTQLPVRALGAASGLRRLVGRLVPAQSGGALRADGTLTAEGKSVRVPGLAGASSYALVGSVVASTHPDSHRIRIFAPRREPL